MKLSPTIALPFFAAALALGAAGCKPIDKSADSAAAKPGATDAAATGDKIPGLATDKEQASYMIGMDLGKSLKPIKDELDLDTVMKAVKTVLADGKPLMTDEQAATVAQAFGKRVQAKKAAEAETLAKTNTTAGAAFLAANGKKEGVQTTASGLQYRITTPGTGPKPVASDTVRVHYKGTTLDGKTFDSSYDRGEPAVFALAQVVPGWQEGLQLLPVGSKATLWLPSELAYGAQGTPGGPIGPNAVLAFDVELIAIEKAGAGAPPAGTPDAEPAGPQG